MHFIQVTVVYALKNIQYIYGIDVVKGCTVKDAILTSNILNICKNICLDKNKIGIYNKLVSLNDKVKNGDRIEIYRNLILDPKERRRQKLISL